MSAAVCSNTLLSLYPFLTSLTLLLLSPWASSAPFAILAALYGLLTSMLLPEFLGSMVLGGLLDINEAFETRLTSTVLFS